MSIERTKTSDGGNVKDHAVVSADHDEDGGCAFRFRQFTVIPGRRLLLRGGRPVDLGSRAFDVLLVLLRSRGTVVAKERVIEQVWPAISVAEGNLRFQMACLRKALGDDSDLIKTVQGRGYLFACEGDSVGMSHSASRASVRFAAADSVSVGERRPGRRSEWRRHEVGRPIVAIIDDDHDTCEALGGLIRSAGLVAASFPSVQAFMDDECPFLTACLVLDVLMPGRSGLDFQTDLSKAGFSIPIIFISGHADVHMSVRAMKAGAVEFLTKPVRYQDLLQAIQACIGAWSSQMRDAELVLPDRYAIASESFVDSCAEA